MNIYFLFKNKIELFLLSKQMHTKNIINIGLCNIKRTNQYINYKLKIIVLKFIKLSFWYQIIKFFHVTLSFYDFNLFSAVWTVLS